MHYSSKKNTYSSFGMVCLVLCLILTCVIFFDSNQSDDFYFFGFLLFTPFPIIFLVIAIYFLNYVEIHNTKIIIKNLIVFWKKKEYQYDEFIYIIYKNKYTSRGSYDGIEIVGKRNIKKNTYWLALSVYGDDFYEILNNELKKKNIKLVDNRIKIYG